MCSMDDCSETAVWYALTDALVILICPECADAARLLGMAVRAVPSP